MSKKSLKKKTLSHGSTNHDQFLFSSKIADKLILDSRIQNFRGIFGFWKGA